MCIRDRNKAVDYEQGEENPTLSGFLEEVALVADIDGLDENSDYVVLMTLHSAKGCLLYTSRCV